MLNDRPRCSLKVGTTEKLGTKSGTISKAMDAGLYAVGLHAACTRRFLLLCFLDFGLCLNIRNMLFYCR